jgi:hypothetical protein
MKPVFILGAGRSGTTLLYKLFCLNNNFAWISNYMAKFPNFVILSSLNRVNTRFPNLNLYSWFNKESNAFYSDRKILKKILPTPVEGEVIYTKGGFEIYPQGNRQLDNTSIDFFKDLVQKIAKYQGKKYFLSKRTANNRRINQLLQCFPDAKFINITRDGRAVAYSLTKVQWWDKHKIWWKDQKTPPELRRENYSDIELAATNWVEEVKCIENGIRNISAENIITLKYEDFAEDSEQYVLKCLKHIGVEPDPDWLSAVRKIRIYNNNHLWEKHLSAKEEEIVMAIQSDKLKELNYI